MAAPITNTFATVSTVGIREDLEDIIYNISPTDFPLMSSFGRTKAQQTLHEWQVDGYASVSTGNAQSEGGDYATSGYTAPTATVRASNRCQISSYAILVSGTDDVVNKAGRGTEIGYQVAKFGWTLKRDMEAILSQNQGLSASEPRKLRSLEAWIGCASTSSLAGVVQNAFFGINGSAASGGYAATTFNIDGTQRAFTETILKQGCKAAWQNGGDPDMLLVGPFNKQTVSGFTGNATRIDKAEDKSVTAAVDVYISDYGSHKVVPSRFNRDRSACLLTSKHYAVAYLRPFGVTDLAKTGDATKKLLLAEYTLVCRNDSGSALLADLTTS